ncbi:MAG TPA: hypothetical protein VK008_07975 [Sphingobacteriaceae bacterium]|nr:hypothetical protein [Sphingobacteriaceae bacterium]
MDWSRAKTILIIAFGLLNAMLYWQVYVLPGPLPTPSFLAEPTPAQVAADLAAVGLELRGDIPSTPAPLPVLEAEPRAQGDPDALAVQFFDPVPPPQDWDEAGSHMYTQGKRALILAPGLVQFTDGNAGRTTPAGTRGQVISPCPAGFTTLTGRSAFIDNLMDEGLEFIEAHGGAPADVQRATVDPDPARGTIRVWLHQTLAGGTPVFNGYVEACMTEAGVARYTRLLWDVDRLLDQGDAVIPASVLLTREARRGGSLYQRARSDEVQQLTVQIGYVVVPSTSVPPAVLLRDEGPLPPFVAVPVWRFHLSSGEWLDFEATTGQRVDYTSAGTF